MAKCSPSEKTHKNSSILGSFSFFFSPLPLSATVQITNVWKTNSLGIGSHVCTGMFLSPPPPLPTLRQIFLGEDHTSRFFPRQAPAFPAYLFVINSTMMDVSSWAADAAGWLHASQRDYGWRKKKKKCEHEKNQVTGGAQSDQNNNRGVCTCVHSCQKWPLPLPLFQGLPSLFGTLWSGAQ